MGPPGTSPRRGGGGGGRTTHSSRKTKKSGGICCKLSLNSLWSIWYCSLAVALQLYIVASGIKRFGQYISLPWPVHDQPYLELNAYVGFLGASVVIMPFFIATAILRIGNYPNDGLDVCTPATSSTKEDYAVYQNIRTKKKEGRWARTMWRHSGPTAAFLHVASAFCLLLPKIFIQPQLIRHGFLKKSELWSSELDFLVSHKNRLITLSFLSTVNTSELLSYEEGRYSSTLPERPVQVEESTPNISAEFINFAISLLVYSIRYPSVLWNSSKTFSFLFSVQLFLNGLQQLLAFTGFSILYKVHICGPSSVLVRFTPLMLGVSSTVLLFFLYNAAMTITSCTLYAYALQKHREWLDRQLRRHHILWVKERWRLWGYTPHVSAFIILVILASAATPIAYDLTIVYCGSLDGIVLASVTSMITHLFLWILLWLFLTIKQRWVFEGRRSYRESRNRLKACSDSRALTCNGHIPGVDEDLSEVRGYRGDAPLLVIDNGHTYQIRERSCRKVILNLASQSISRQTNSSSTDDEDIYWLKPKSSPKARDEVMNDEQERSWVRNPKKSPPGPRPHKVTFEEALLNSSSTRRKSAKHQAAAKIKKSHVNIEDFVETGSEEGDYATLTNVPEIENHDSGQAYRSLCPLGKSRMARVEGTERLVSSLRRAHLPYFEPGSESTKSTDSGTDTFPASTIVNSKPTDNFSVDSNSPEKGQCSETSSGIHSGSISNPSNLNTGGNSESVTVWSNCSVGRRTEPASLDEASTSHDTAGPTIRIWRNPGTQENDRPFGRDTQVKFTTFSENPGCVVGSQNL